MAQKSAPKAGSCDKRGRWFGFGIPVAVLLVTLGVALAVGASALAQSKQATTSSFRRAAVAAGAVLRASLGTQLDRLNAAGRAIEVRGSWSKAFRQPRLWLRGDKLHRLRLGGFRVASPPPRALDPARSLAGVRTVGQR